MSERLISWLVLSFITITVLVSAAAIFVPSISEAATVIGLIIGGYVSILSGVGVGAAVTRKIRQEADNDKERRQ